MSVGSGISPATGIVDRALRVVRSRSVLSVIDQGVVSAANFLAVVMIGRWGGPSELGAYALGASLLAILIAMQDALVTRPYSIQVRRPIGSPGSHAFGALTLSIALSVIGALALAGAGTWAVVQGHPGGLLLLYLALALPLLLCREFARRHAFAHLDIGSALALDVMVSVVLIGGLGLLAVTGFMYAPKAFLVAGFACLAGCVWWFGMVRDRFQASTAHMREVGVESWRLGRWLLVGAVAVQIQSYGAHWLSFGMLGTAATGVFAACVSIVAFANPLIFGLSNIMTPRCVEALHKDGLAALWRQTLRDTAVMGGVLGLFTAAVALGGAWLLTLLYPANAYAEGTDILTALAWAALAGSLGVPAGAALAAMERARALAVVNILAAVVTFGAVYLGIRSFGLVGAALGLLAGEAFGAVSRWIAFVAATRGFAVQGSAPGSAPAVQGLPVPPSPEISPMRAVTDEGASTASGAVRSSDPERSKLLLDVIAALDGWGVRWCVLHGAERFPEPPQSDIDCLIDPSVDHHTFLTFLQALGAQRGITLVHARGGYVVLARTTASGRVVTVAFDVARDLVIGNALIYRGAEILEGVERSAYAPVPRPAVAFAAYLVRSLVKGRVSGERGARLSALYEQDPEGAALELRDLFDGSNAAQLAQIARARTWDELDPAPFAADVLARAQARYPIAARLARVRTWAGRLARLWRPDGMRVVVLGTDGAGKSSTIEAMATRDFGIFQAVEDRGFAPMLFRRVLKRKPGPTDQPHALPPRSMAASLVRAGYWLTYYVAEWPALRLTLARSTLILYDRHFVDILVDRRRYRYGGPVWALRAIWTVLPKPDLVILLDAPAEVLQSRKQELPFEETARQRQAYLDLVRTLPNGRIVDASRTFPEVLDQVSALLLATLAARTARRHGLPAPDRRSTLDA